MTTIIITLPAPVWRMDIAGLTQLIARINEGATEQLRMESMPEPITLFLN